jgi:hypothetical protein
MTARHRAESKGDIVLHGRERVVEVVEEPLPFLIRC